MDPRTLEQLAQDAAGVLAQGHPHTVIRSVSTDSRTIGPDQLFIPLAGRRFDGHAFLPDAAARGAAAALVRRGAVPQEAWPKGMGVIVVDDTLAALQRLAAAQRSRLQGTVTAVTGSVGKTTTKDMLAAIGRVRARLVATKGNFNNEIGLPLTVLEADETTELLVLEMGMRGAGEIRALARLARPHAGIVTNVGPVHVERLGGLEGIAAAKRELVEELPADGVAVLNGDDPPVRGMADGAPCRAVFFGLSKDNDVRAAAVESFGERGSRFVLQYGGRERAVALPVPGRHHVMNALAAAAAALAIGFDLDDVVRGLAAAHEQRSAMRTDVTLTEGGIRVVNDAYNAGPASMAAALQLLSELQADRRVAVLGDMLELGPLAEQAHAEVGKEAARLGVDVLIAVGRWGPVMARSAAAAGLRDENVHVCRDAAEAAALARRLVRPGDAVLVKASRGVMLEQVAERLLQSSREVRHGGGEPEG